MYWIISAQVAKKCNGFTQLRGGNFGGLPHTGFRRGGEDHGKIEHVGKGAMAKHILPKDIWLLVAD